MRGHGVLGHPQGPARKRVRLMCGRAMAISQRSLKNRTQCICYQNCILVHVGLDGSLAALCLSNTSIGQPSAELWTTAAME